MSALFLAVPLTIFMLFVAPIWLWLHYSNRRSGNDISGVGEQHLQQLTQDAQRMRDRIRALEAILDAEHPGWRQP